MHARAPSVPHAARHAHLSARPVHEREGQPGLAKQANYFSGGWAGFGSPIGPGMHDCQHRLACEHTRQTPDLTRQQPSLLRRQCRSTVLLARCLRVHIRLMRHPTAGGDMPPYFIVRPPRGARPKTMSDRYAKCFSYSGLRVKAVRRALHFPDSRPFGASSALGMSKEEASYETLLLRRLEAKNPCLLRCATVQCVAARVGRGSGRRGVHLRLVAAYAVPYSFCFTSARSARKVWGFHAERTDAWCQPGDNRILLPGSRTPSSHISKTIIVRCATLRHLACARCTPSLRLGTPQEARDFLETIRPRVARKTVENLKLMPHCLCSVREGQRGRE